MLALFLIVLAASATQGSTGFGFGLITMALLPLVVPLEVASVVVTCDVVMISLGMTWRLRHEVSLRLVMAPLSASIVLTPLGVYVLTVANEAILRIALGSLIVLLSLFLLLNGSERFQIASTPRNGMIAGATSGVMNGMFNIGGPPLVVYFMRTARDKLAYKAALDFVFLTGAIIRLFAVVLYGAVQSNALPFVMVSLIAGGLGTLVGFGFFARIDRTMLSRAIHALLIAAGISLIITR
jgi:uncharacterized membrane protein YfcA